MQQTANGNLTQEGSIAALKQQQGQLTFTAVTAHLYQSGFGPSRASVYADFLANEANFTGYASAPLVFGTVGTDDAGNAVSYNLDETWQATDAVSPNSIGGLWLSGSFGVGPTNVSLAWYPFPVPVNMATALKTLNAVVAWTEPNFPGYVNVDS
jgi:hypothetical protein